MNDIERALTLIVPNEPMSNSELENMFRNYDIAQKAQAAFLNGEMSFSDYIETVEEAEVDIDDYLEDIEVNLELADVL